MTEETGSKVEERRRSDDGVGRWLAPIGAGIVGLGTGVGISNTDAALEVLSKGGPAVIGAALGIGAAIVLIKQQSAAFQTAFKAQALSRDKSEKLQADAIDKLRESHSADSRAIVDSLGAVKESLSPLVAMIGLLVGMKGKETSE